MNRREEVIEKTRSYRKDTVKTTGAILKKMLDGNNPCIERTTTRYKDTENLMPEIQDQETEENTT